MKEQLTLLVDLRKCVGCGSCQISCKMENDTPMFKFRSKLNVEDTGKYPNPKRHFLPVSCNQCENPPCTKICPADATYQVANGIVVIEPEKCIGCESCISACPYAARYMKEGKGREKIADKCDYCLNLVEQSQEPACVRNCMGGARYFGNSADPQSEVSKLIKNHKLSVWQKKENTGPRTVYILKHPNTFEIAGQNINN